VALAAPLGSVAIGSRGRLASGASSISSGGISPGGYQAYSAVAAAGSSRGRLDSSGGSSPVSVNGGQAYSVAATAGSSCGRLDSSGGFSQYTSNGVQAYSPASRGSISMVPSGGTSPTSANGNQVFGMMAAPNTGAATYHTRGGLPQQASLSLGSLSPASFSPPISPQAKSCPISPQACPISPTTRQGKSSQPQVGSHTQVGRKPGNPDWENQDRHFDVPLPGGQRLLGVLDGHGSHGHLMSQRVKDIFTGMAPSIAVAADTKAAFQQAFAQCAAQIEKEEGCENSGSTATLALIDPSKQTVSIAHVGDSTALLMQPGGGIAFQTREHKADAEGERQRLEAHGSQISNGRLCMSSNPRWTFALARSIGDISYKPQGVIAEPEVACGLPFLPGSALIVASDGLWDMVSAAEVISKAMHANAGDAAKVLVNISASRWGDGSCHMDDITTVVVKSLPNDTSDSGSPMSKSFGSPMFASSPSSPMGRKSFGLCL